MTYTVQTRDNDSDNGTRSECTNMREAIRTCRRIVAASFRDAARGSVESDGRVIYRCRNVAGRAVAIN